MLPSVRNNGYLKCRVKYVLIRWMILTCVDSCGCDICVWFGKGFCASAKVWKTFGFPDSRARSHAPKPPAAASICIRLRYMFTFAFANIISHFCKSSSPNYPICARIVSGTLAISSSIPAGFLPPA